MDPVIPEPHTVRESQGQGQAQNQGQADYESDGEEGPVMLPLVLGEDEECDELNVQADVDAGPSIGEAPHDAPHNHLDQFRQQWKAELHNKPDSRSHSPEPAKLDTEEEEVEQRARDLFKQGMDAEDNGSLSLAIYFYKKALHLVPDIEAKVSADFIKNSPRVRQESESSMEGSEADERLIGDLEHLTLEDDGLCQMQYEQRATHVSCLPLELVILVLRWLVADHMDFRSLEQFSLVCKGFYMCARDETVWKLACEKIWGSNIGSKKKYGHSFRRMLLERPHLLFDGCYISKVTYVRQGEQSCDQFYRPFHLVEYYRYVRFFPDGVALMYVSADDPLTSLPRLTPRGTKDPGMLKGRYKLMDNKVTMVMSRVHQSDNSTSSRYKRHRRAAEQNDSELTYSVEFDVMSSGRRAHSQLVWGSYSARTLYRSSRQESVSNFELSRQSFPPLIFSRVKSYLAVSQEPLA